jgi:MFS family permease
VVAVRAARSLLLADDHDRVRHLRAAVALSLFLAGHLSDWHGRRRVLVPALLLQIVAGVVFLVWPSLPGLLLARVLSGLGIGAVTATATAWLSELRGADSQRASHPISQPHPTST